MAEYTKPTDEVHVVTLESKITHAIWRTKAACMEEKAVFEIWTHFVGNGSDIHIKVQDKRGKTVGKVKGKVYGDYFAGSVIVPKKAKEELSFTAKLPNHGLEMKSDILKVIPTIAVTNMKWGQKEARREDLVKLTADIEGVPDETEVMIHIYEHDQDGAHDFITKFPTWVENKKIVAEWEFEYHEDTDDIPIEDEMQPNNRHYAHPEYFWVAAVYGKTFGEEQESGLVRFIDWLEVNVVDENGNIASDLDYTVQLADGSEMAGRFDGSDEINKRKIPPGRAFIRFQGIYEEEN